MKKIFFGLLFLLSLQLSSQTKLSEAQKYKQIGLVWGLLKYHHPEISNGNYDWDSEFVKLFAKADALETQEAMNDLLLDFISKYKTNKLKPKKINSEKLFLKNVDYDWIDSNVFGEKLTNALVEIKEIGNINNHYASMGRLAKMISFENEKGFKDFDYTVKSHRLLLLYSFWNAIQYWDVNLYLTDEKWLSILDSITSYFVTSKTQFEFEMGKHKMISKLNDSHAEYGSRVVSDSIFKFKPFFGVKNINDSLVVNSISNKENAIKDNLVLGDIITKIDNKSISTCIKEGLSNLISASNPSFLKQYSYLMLYNTIDSINVEILKQDGAKINKFIHLYKTQAANQQSFLEKAKKEKWFFVKPSIAYVNLDKMTKKELDFAFEQMSNTKGLILDLRNYPKNISGDEIVKYFYPKRKEFIKVLFPMENNPSYGEYDGESPLKLIADPFKTGGLNPDYYKGKIILLVNGRTQSRAEFMGMAIQQSPNCITIGEQTAGAVMNVVNYTMPDKTKVNFTGLGAFYPNGEGAQRKGVRIDYYVKESATNYDPELYIKEAVRLIEK